MADKKIVIDLRWVFFPLVICAIVSYAALRLVRLAVRTTLQGTLILFMSTGVGYLILYALDGTGWYYTHMTATWKGNSAKFPVTRDPRWAFSFLGFKSELYTVRLFLYAIWPQSQLPLPEGRGFSERRSRQSQAEERRSG